MWTQGKVQAHSFRRMIRPYLTVIFFIKVRDLAPSSIWIILSNGMLLPQVSTISTQLKKPK